MVKVKALLPLEQTDLLQTLHVNLHVHLQFTCTHWTNQIMYDLIVTQLYAFPD